MDPPRAPEALRNVDLTLKVEGLAVFYVINEASGTETNFVLLGIVDQTQGGKSTESHSWTNVKSLFD